MEVLHHKKHTSAKIMLTRTLYLPQNYLRVVLNDIIALATKFVVFVYINDANTKL